MYNMPGNGKE